MMDANILRARALSMLRAGTLICLGADSKTGQIRRMWTERGSGVFARVTVLR